MTTEYLLLPATTGQLRVLRNGALVVPVVALVGDIVIHALNAPTAEFVPATTLSESNAAAWNGKPVTLGHPTRNGSICAAGDAETLATYGLGVVRNARVSNGKLLADLHVDESRARALGAGRLLARLRAGETVEVSVGAMVRTENEDGIFGGESYGAIWRHIVPDHVAILEHSRGACSCDHGCGTFQRAAEHRAEHREGHMADKDTHTAPKHGWTEAFKREGVNIEQPGPTVNEKGHLIRPSRGWDEALRRERREGQR